MNDKASLKFYLIELHDQDVYSEFLKKKQFHSYQQEKSPECIFLYIFCRYLLAIFVNCLAV